MFITNPEAVPRRGFTRRQVSKRVAAFFAAGAAAPLFSEFALAQEAERQFTGSARPAVDEYVRINSNENPLGPCREGLEAMAKIGPYGGRYSPFQDYERFLATVAESEEIGKDYVASFAGSSDPLFRATCAFTSPRRSWVMADPGYGGGAPAYIGSKLVRVPLRADYSHDIEGMLSADRNAGAYYVCNPNNPTGTLTAHRDIEYLVANKPKGAVVIVDEAYIHFGDKSNSARDLVLAGKDVIILRTFSKVYGMAGIRSGFAMARPDLLEKLAQYGDDNLPITALACATASLQTKHLVAERRGINRQIREDVFAFLKKKDIQYIPSETNFFMMEVNRPGVEFAKAMVAQKVLIGRIWPTWPTKVRVSIGTQDDMDAFRAAVQKVWG
jgi:histidinol-phosphate/aromatic aminotransferase/cobyric acid decarboxylase-like protein